MNSSISSNINSSPRWATDSARQNNWSPSINCRDKKRSMLNVLLTQWKSVKSRESWPWIQVGKDPCIIIWDSEDLHELVRLNHGPGYRGIQAVCFSSGGSKIAAVATDNNHTMFIWNWRTKECLLSRKTQAGTPPTVYGVEWSRFEQNRIVTYGKNHIKVSSPFCHLIQMPENMV